MKKFIMQCTCMLVLLLVPVIGSLFLLKSENCDTYLLANVDKNERLASIKEPKLVLIGGSNLAFGLNCKVLEDSLSLSPVNMGLHASIGLRYMMREVEPYLTSGDVLLIVPEYEQFTSECFYGEFPLFEILTREGKYNILFGDFRYYPYMCDQLQIFRNNLLSKLTSPLVLGDYSRSNFNIYGDNTGHWNLPSKPIMDIPLKGEPQQDIVKQVAAYIGRMEKRGVKSYVFPPVYKKGSALLSEEFIRQTEKQLKENEIPFQVSPDKYIFADSLFYDTMYHLNKQGVDKRTGLLLNDLKAILVR